jgi:hypothetical protein
MSFRRTSRERLRAELAAAVKRMDVQSVHSIIAENGGDADDVAAVIGTSPAAEQLRQALVADYREWAAEMVGDDAADDVPAVLVALAQPSLFSTLELS